MYKYMEMRPAKPEKKAKKGIDDADLSDEFAEDADLEQFADEEMQR